MTAFIPSAAPDRVGLAFAYAAIVASSFAAGLLFGWMIWN